MNSSFYELTWYFLIYGFLGWCLEIIYAAVKKHHFYNRGILDSDENRKRIDLFFDCFYGLQYDCIGHGFGVVYKTARRRIGGS